MNTDPNQQPGPRQPEDGDDKELNLTRSNAMLADHTLNKQPLPQ